MQESDKKQLVEVKVASLNLEAAQKRLGEVMKERKIQENSERKLMKNFFRNLMIRRKRDR